MHFSSDHRSTLISHAGSTHFDLLIIGGGITGAGILLDARARGLKAALIEMQDFAAGTSSRSTKLIHGGLRYLKQMEFRLVAEVGRERAVVYENGPHVTRSEPMLLPLVKGGTINTFAAFAGIWLYDKLAGVRKKEHRRMLGVEETLSAEPLLTRENLNGGVCYYEYRTDDARLTIEVLKEGAERGGLALNYCMLRSFVYDGSVITGAVVEDLAGGNTFNIAAKSIVNAAGPWVDDVMKLDDGKKAGNLFLTKGVHIVVDYHKLPLKQSVYFDVPDGRMVFAIPREGKTYIGTTDTEYHGSLEDPQITREDKEYLLKAVNRMFPGLTLSMTDIESGWAGLRPLIREPGKSPSAISRKDEIYVNASGLISIAGGKLTGYRKMAKKIVDKVFKQQKRKMVKCTTHLLPVSGGKVGGPGNFENFLRKAIREGEELGLSGEEARLLSQTYGSNVQALYEIVKNNRPQAEQAEMPAPLFARLVYAIEQEMALTPADFFIRRTGMMYFHIEAVIRYRDAVTRYMKGRFQWSEETESRHREDLEKQIVLARGA